MKSLKISSDDRIALLGSSRGLGWATYQYLLQVVPQASFFLSSRKIQARSAEVSKKTILKEQDFSKTPVDSHYLQDLENFQPTQIIYFAGGGPYGFFKDKKWADHQWALTTSFLYPAELVHRILSEQKKWSSLQQITLIGSAIAEDKADPMAASYAAAKHGLKGLVSTLAQEGAQKPFLQLFSPGYMQTDLLPPQSKPRQQGLAEDPEHVAKKLIAFIEKSD